MMLKRWLGFVALTALPVFMAAQGLDPALSPFTQPADAWPTYNGDYSGRRFSALKEITAANVHALTLAWMFRISGVGQQRGVGEPTIKSTPLMVNGVLYFTIPDHVFALDARTGDQIWQYSWEDKGGHLVGQRGVGIYKDWVYFLAPDGWFISLNAKDGTERWRKKIADEKMQYFTTSAALIVKDHVIIGVGGDAMDLRGYLESRDPETGDLQWRWYTTPLKMGDPGSETWPSQDALDHGGGMTWLPGTYDPALNLIYWGTGNANPVYSGKSRAGANLWTASIVALNPDTGKLVWYFQPTPHDTHDWDNVETPVLFDAAIDGQPRKLLAQAARSGFFVVLDRTNGQSVVTKAFVGGNWATGLDAKGQPIPDPAKAPTVDGSLVNTPAQGAANWPPPSYNPDTELFYVNAHRGYSVGYLYDTADKPQGYAGGSAGLWQQAVLQAIDVRTGAIRWAHEYNDLGGGGAGGGNAGILTTAGGLLFTGGSGTAVVAYGAADGKTLWHLRLTRAVSNGPSTWMLNGTQYLVVGAGDTLYVFKVASPN